MTTDNVVIIGRMGGMVTTTETNKEVRFKNFTKKREPVWFQVDEDRFQALPVLPVPTMQLLIGQANALQGKAASPETLGEILHIFDTVLVPESAARFTERLKSTDNPVDLIQVMDILTWLMEGYGQRPTQQSSGSSDGLPSGTDGTISTAGVSVAE